MALRRTSQVKKGPNKRAGEKGPNVRPMSVFDEDRQARFLEHLAKTGRRLEAALAAGVCWGSVDRMRKRDREFKLKLDEAIDTYNETIDAEIARRGMEGVTKDIYYQGVVVGTEQVYSDQLLLAHARARVPAYKDKVAVETTATVSLGLEALDASDRAALRHLLKDRAAKEGSAESEEVGS